MAKISPNIAQDSGIEYLISQGGEGREQEIESYRHNQARNIILGLTHCTN
jgi:hypothetical protein